MRRSIQEKIMRAQLTSLLLLGICVSARVAWGQDNGSAPTLDTAPTVQIASEGNSALEPNAGRLSDGSEVRQLGTASFLNSNFGIAHWGPFSLGTTTLSQAYQRGTGESNSLSSLRTELMAGRTFGRNHLMLQYSPKLTVLNGQVVKNLSDQDSSIDTYFALGPRLRLSLNDRFQSYTANSVIDGPFFTTDTFRSSFAQNAFLQGPTESKFTMNTTQVGLGFLVSPRTHLNVIPAYSFQSWSGSTGAVRSQIYGGVVQLEHAVTPTKTVGLYYEYEAIRIKDRTGPYVTPYDTVGITYSQQLTPTWGISTSLGAYKEGLPQSQGTKWSGNANFGTAKIFGKSSISLDLFRGQGLAGVITSTTVNRADLLYHHTLSRKLSVDAGSGYAVFKLARSANGLYGTVGFDWQLRPTLSWFTTFGYTKQTGDGIQIATLASDFVAFGIRWHPRVAAR
jgi:hypothetical protein